MSGDENAVLRANAAFYQAFAARDLRAMTGLWAREAQVVCIHPGWDVLVGRDAVLGSWRDILANPENPQLECRNARAHLFDDVALVTCHEVLSEGVLVAANLFRREDDGWRMIHHQSGPLSVLPSPPPSRPSGTVH
jgi:ketosteroid isomerase-like protein